MWVDVADAEGDRVGVKRVVGKRQRLGVALRERDAGFQLRRADAAAPDRDHLRADVAQHGRCVGAARARVADRHVARAAGDVDEAERPLPARRVEDRDEVVLPQPVQAARHQVVHQVVALGDGGEDLVDEALALAFRHLAVSEARLRRRRRKGLASPDNSEARLNALWSRPLPIAIDITG